MSGKEVAVDKVILKAKTFLQGVSKYSRDQEITARLGKVVSDATRVITYKVANDSAYRGLKNIPLIRQELRKQLVSEMVNQRVFERAREKKEPLKLAEKISQDMTNELETFRGTPSDAKLFAEAICLIHESRDKGFIVI